MKLQVKSHDDSDDDCRRTSYYVEYKGHRLYLCSCALGNYYNYLECLEEAAVLFTDDVELDFSGVSIQTEDPYEEPYEEDDVWADADTLASCGWGTDEDYGCFGSEDW